MKALPRKLISPRISPESGLDAAPVFVAALDDAALAELAALAALVIADVAEPVTARALLYEEVAELAAAFPVDDAAALVAAVALPVIMPGP